MGWQNHISMFFGSLTNLLLFTKKLSTPFNINIRLHAVTKGSGEKTSESRS